MSANTLVVIVILKLIFGKHIHQYFVIMSFCWNFCVSCWNMESLC